MSKKKKHDNVINIKDKTKDSGAKKTMSEKKKWLMAVLVSIPLMIGIAYFIEQGRLDKEGLGSQDALIRTFFEAMEQQSQEKLNQCLLHLDSNYKDISNTLMAHIAGESNVKTVDYDGMIIQSGDMDQEVIGAMEDIMMLKGIENAATAYAEVPITREKDGITYETTTYYTFVMYGGSGKWYLFDADKQAVFVEAAKDADGKSVDISDSYRLFNDLMIGGDDEVGYIPLDNTWYAMENTEATPIEGAVKDLGYMNETGTATIHMVKIKTDKTVDELGEKLLANLTNDETKKVDITSESTDLNGRNAHCISFYNQTTDLFFFSFIIDTKKDDGHVRYLTLESTKDYAAGAMYLSAYLTPGEYAANQEIWAAEADRRIKELTGESEDSTGQATEQETKSETE